MTQILVSLLNPENVTILSATTCSDFTLTDRQPEEAAEVEISTRRFSCLTRRILFAVVWEFCLIREIVDLWFLEPVRRCMQLNGVSVTREILGTKLFLFACNPVFCNEQQYFQVSCILYTIFSAFINILHLISCKHNSSPYLVCICDPDRGTLSSPKSNRVHNQVCLNCSPHLMDRQNGMRLSKYI